MTLEAVRDLHAPQPDYGNLICRGCDGDYDMGPSLWPCGTADLVYTAEEIETATEAADLEYRWRSSMERRNKSLAPRDGISTLITRAYEKYLEMALRAEPLMKSLTACEPTTGKTVTFTRVDKLGTTIKVSKALMEDS